MLARIIAVISDACRPKNKRPVEVPQSKDSPVHAWCEHNVGDEVSGYLETAHVRHGALILGPQLAPEHGTQKTSDVVFRIDPFVYRSEVYDCIVYRKFSQTPTIRLARVVELYCPNCRKQRRITHPPYPKLETYTRCSGCGRALEPREKIFASLEEYRAYHQNAHS